jgi:hypothetical protein
LDATGEYAGLTFSDVDGVWTSTETANNQRLVFSTTTGNLSVMAVAVPEPSTCAMAMAGLAYGEVVSSLEPAGRHSWDQWAHFSRRARARPARTHAYPPM